MIKRKTGKCDYPGCNYQGILYAKGKCQSHYWVSRQNAKAEKETAKVDSLQGKQIELFKTIFKFKQVCFVSEERIYYFSPSNFDHVLPKKMYPLFRYYRKNIAVLTKEYHNQKHRLTVEDRMKKDKRWVRFFRLEAELLEEYNLVMEYLGNKKPTNKQLLNMGGLVKEAREYFG